MNVPSFLARWALLALAVCAGTAAAETTSPCVAPAPVAFPLTTTWNFVNGDANGSTGFGPQVNVVIGNARETGRSIFLFADNYRRASDYAATTPTPVTIGDVRFLRFGFVWADNGAKSYQTVANWSYAGTTFLTLATSAGLGTAGTVTASNGAVLYSASGQPLGTSTPFAGQAEPYTLTGAEVSSNIDRSHVEYVYVKLPDTLPGGAPLPPSGNFSVDIPPAAVTDGLFDDIRMYLPESVQSYLCLRKQQNSGTLGAAFQLTTTGLDHKTNADSDNSDSVTIRPPSLDAAFAKTTLPAQLSRPERVTIQENAAGYTVSKVVCDTPGDLSGLPAQTQVSASDTPLTFAITGLPFGAMTTCTVFNEASTQLVDRAPTVTLAKNFLRHQETDQVNLAVSSAGQATSLTTAGTQTSYTTVALKDTNYTYQSFTRLGAVGAQIVFPTYTFSESYIGTALPVDYEVTYQCQNTTQGTIANLPSGHLSGPYSFIFQPTLDLVNLGDNVTCTITNAAKNTATLNLVKSGPSVSLPSTPTGNVDVTYTITVTSKGQSVAGAYVSNVLVTDTFTQGTFKSATPAPNSVDAGQLTWNLSNFAYNDTTPRVITVVLTMPQAAAAQSLSAGSRSVSNNANYTASRYACAICSEIPETGVPTGVVTHLLLLDTTKTVRNVTKGETVASASNSGKPGDILEYCVNVSNASDLAAENFVLRDAVSSFLKPVGNDTDYALSFGSSTVREPSPFVVNIGTVPAASASGPGTARLCFQAQIR